MGVAVARAVSRSGCSDVWLKWPNDLIIAGCKLGGILLEVAGEMAGPTRVVAGIGLNVQMPAAARDDVDQPWIDLQRAVGQRLSRNRVAAALVDELLPALAQFASQGFAPFAAEWAARDVSRDRPVVLRTGSAETRGVARGVDGAGALLLDVGGRLERFHGGEVSLRVQA